MRLMAFDLFYSYNLPYKIQLKNKSGATVNDYLIGISEFFKNK